MTQRSVDTFAVVVLLLGAFAFAAFGVQWLAHPQAMAQPLGIVLTNGDATSDARAVYGGMELGLGLFLAYSAGARARRSQGLAAAALVLAGLGVCRFTGILLEGSAVGAGTWQLLATDVGDTALCASAFVVTRFSTPGQPRE